MKARPNPTKREVRNALRMYASAAPDPERAAKASASLGLDLPERRRPAPDARKRPVARAPGASEAQVLNAVLALLRHHPAVSWVRRMNTGAAEFGEQFVRFGFVGCSDIIGQLKARHGGRFLAVEVKREHGGVVSEAQQVFLDRVAADGGVAGAVRSADEAAALLARFDPAAMKE